MFKSLSECAVLEFSAFQVERRCWLNAVVWSAFQTSSETRCFWAA